MDVIIKEVKNTNINH